MDPQVKLNVTFQNDTQSFLVSDSASTTWADVEAMVKVSFELNEIQIKYLDEDHDEIAVKQGNQLQMNVYELSTAPDMLPQQAPETSVVHKDGRKPLSHYSSLARTLAQGKVMEKEREQVRPFPILCYSNATQDFREQVVQETVEMLEQKLNEKLLLSSQPPSSLSSSTHQAPVSPPVQSNPFDWLLSCSNCQAPIVGIRYQCSVCPSYSICELCEAGAYAHDPNHVLLKLRRPILCISESYNLGQFSPRLATLEQVRLQKQMDKRFLKAEKQRLRAEKKQRKAEVRELKKQLKLHRKIHLWNSSHALENTSLTVTKTENLQSSTLLPLQGCPVIVPTLSAAFVDENLPDGTCLKPRTTFIKHWRMRNTGNMEWSSDTKLKFMWGNLTLLSSEKKDVIVPFLLPGQVGVVSVQFVSPAVEGTYTSHWRLSHRGEQFGPRIWCSIVVDPNSSNTGCTDSCKLVSTFCQKGRSLCKEEGGLVSRAAPTNVKSILSAREFYIPSVDLLTAQDLLSFELLDINIVQELEQVPRNTPVDTTPDMSVLPHDSSPLDNTSLDQKQEEMEENTCKQLPDALMGKGKTENSANQEEAEEDMSGRQFVCETVIRSLTLDAAPDHRPPQRKKSLQGKCFTPVQCCTLSARLEKAAETSAHPEGVSHLPVQNINDMLTTSQTLDEVPLIPQIVELQPTRIFFSYIFLISFSFQHLYRHTQGNSIAGGLVKGALSVAASAYKALFAGPPSLDQVNSWDHMATFLANLSEMGFRDRHLNLRLLRKHNCDMAQVVTELLQLSHSDWYESQY
uniref:Next to BRCA1 gene 1 protein n=1 Tax=Anolis carolinensis TaxID=28377 RepID=G1KNQ0_ANOCA